MALLLILFRFSESNNGQQLGIENVIAERFNLLYIKIVLDKIKQLLGLLLTLHRNMSGWKSQSRARRKHLALYGLLQPDIFLCKVSNEPYNL